MAMRVRPFSRRNLLRGLGAAGLIAPFAAQLKPGRAVAAPQKRAMFVYVPDGCIPALWHPTGSEKAFTLPEMSAPLESIKQHLVFLDGLKMYAGGATHEGGMAKVLTGVSPKSIDLFLGDEIGGATPHSSLQLGVGGTFQAGAPGTFTFIGENQPVPPDDDPLNAFSRVFGAVSGDPGQDAAQRKKQSVLDAALEDLNALRTRLGSTERAKLDVHLDSLREVEARISGAGVKACDVAGWNDTRFVNIETDYYPKTYHKEENFALMSRLQIDLAVTALSCGATNVVSLQYSHQVSPTHILDTGITTANHDASHYGEPTSQFARDFVALKRWFMGEFKYLIEQLEATPDVEGSLLDNTLVMLCSELGDSVHPGRPGWRRARDRPLPRLSQRRQAGAAHQAARVDRQCNGRRHRQLRLHRRRHGAAERPVVMLRRTASAARPR
jgi:hypothetical protein